MTRKKENLLDYYKKNTYEKGLQKVIEQQEADRLWKEKNRPGKVKYSSSVKKIETLPNESPLDEYLRKTYGRTVDKMRGW